MPNWDCAIAGCERAFDSLEAILTHQVADHDSHDCRVCEQSVPEGYFAIKHGLESHTRSDYVRQYDADPEDVRRREQLIETVEETVDIDRLRTQIDGLE